SSSSSKFASAGRWQLNKHSSTNVMLLYDYLVQNQFAPWRTALRLSGCLPYGPNSRQTTLPAKQRALEPRQWRQSAGIVAWHASLQPYDCVVPTTIFGW